MHINDLLKMASERKASDLHLKVGSHPVLRINGELIPLVETKRLMQEDTIAMAFSIMSARQKQKFKDHFELDMAYSVPGLGRFRCNVFQQRGTVGLVLRVIPVKIMTVRELGLPQTPVSDVECGNRRVRAACCRCCPCRRRAGRCERRASRVASCGRPSAAAGANLPRSS